MFSNLKNKTAFMPYVCCGDPSVNFTLNLVKTLAENGADAIELGIPFSDPIADGRTIQTASSRALKNGFNPKKIFEVIKKIRQKKINIPIIVTTYYNIVYANKIKKFLDSIKKAGANGLIVPDVPYEESNLLHRLCTKAGIDLVYLISMNCSDERIKKISKKSRGFIYAVSVFGITGARKKVSSKALELIKRAKKITSTPIVAGFGISKPEHARILTKAGADGFIIGSELINIYSRYIAKERFNEKKALEQIAEFTKKIKHNT